MVHLSLINMKENKKKILGIKKFNPIKNNLSTYMIKVKSNEIVQIQFYLYEKLIKFIKIKHKLVVSEYKKISSDGIFISCILTKDEPLEIYLEPLDLCSEIIIKQFKKYINFKSNLTNIKWDNIFIINLKRRTDRKKDIEKKLYEQNIKNYEFIEAYDGNEQHIQKEFNELKKKNNIQIISYGHYACLLSHLKAIKLAKTRNYSNIMILEDDIYFCNDFLSKISSLMVPSYDMIYLGGITNKIKLFFNDWVRYSNIMGAYGYILNSKLFDIVLTQLENLNDYIDVFYFKKIQPIYKTILLADYIKTDLTTSDTSNKSQKLIKRLNYIKI